MYFSLSLKWKKRFLEEFQILVRFAGQYGHILTLVVKYVCAETVVSFVHNRLYFYKEHVIPTRGVHPRLKKYWAIDYTWEPRDNHLFWAYLQCIFSISVQDGFNYWTPVL